MKILLTAFLGIISIAAGALVSNFFVQNIKRAPRNILSYQAFITGIMTDQKHLMMFLVFSILIFIGFTYILFFKRTISATKINMVQLTPQIEVPAAAGQKQYGSARFTTVDEQKKIFKSVELSSKEASIAELIHEGDEDIKEIKKGIIREPRVMDLPEKLIPFGGIPVSYTAESYKEKIMLISGDVHTVTFGATRCGKSRTLVIQSVCTQGMAGCNMVISDPKGELFQFLYIFLARMGYKVYALDFKNPEKSVHINFLQFVIDAINQSNISKAIQCCWDFVDGLVAEPKSDAPLWTNGEKALLAAGIMQVVYDNSPTGLRNQYPDATEEQLNQMYEDTHKQYQNCSNVFNYISKMAVTNPQSKNLWLVDIIDVLPDDHPSKLIMAIAESAPDKMRGSFITSALTTLRLFTDPNISAMTAETDEGFLDLNTKKAIFMIVPDSKKTYYPLVSLFCNQYYQYIADFADELGGRLPRNVEFNLDEFGNFSRMPDFDVKMTVGAGRGIHFNLYLQSKEQLVERYGKEIASIVLDNCHYWIYLKSGVETCKLIEEKLSKYTVQSSSASASMNDNGGLSTSLNSGSTSTSTQLMARSLLTSDEVAKIARPYLLVMSDDGYSSLLQSPDLHKWQFNRMLGLGDEDHNTKVRMLREKMRSVRPTKGIVLWDFRPYINNLLDSRLSAQNEGLEEDILREIGENFADSF